MSPRARLDACHFAKPRCLGLPGVTLCIKETKDAIPSRPHRRAAFPGHFRGNRIESLGVVRIHLAGLATVKIKEELKVIRAVSSNSRFKGDFNGGLKSERPPVPPPQYSPKGRPTNPWNEPVGWAGNTIQIADLSSLTAPKTSPGLSRKRRGGSFEVKLLRPFCASPGPFMPVVQLVQLPLPSQLCGL